MSENIFTQGSNLAVNFDNIKQDLVNRGRSRLLSQFIRSELLVDLLDALSQECQELYDSQINVLEQRTLDKAEGVNLDIIGELVGADKTLYDASLLPWFAPDIEGREVDSAELWVVGAPVTGNLTAPDKVWRKLILAKIFKNHLLYGSHAEIRWFVKMMSNLKISFQNIGVCEVILVIPAGTSESQIRFLVSTIQNTSISYSFLLPIPAEVKLIRDRYLVSVQNDEGISISFAPDMESGIPDYARATIIATIGEI